MNGSLVEGVHQAKAGSQRFAQLEDQLAQMRGELVLDPAVIVEQLAMSASGFVEAIVGGMANSAKSD